MEIIKKFQSNELGCNVECVVADGMQWFRGKDVAIALGYTNTTQAVQIHVEAEDKHELKQLGHLDSIPLDTHNFNTNQLS